MNGVLVVGAGGHAKVVADILVCTGIVPGGFLDDDEITWGDSRLGFLVLGSIDSYGKYTPKGLVMGIGSNLVREQVVSRLGSDASSLWHSAIHPRATVAPSAQIGQGVTIAAGAIVNPEATIGDFAIINTGATIDHDCVIGSYAHIAPGAHLSGGVRVGVGALIGVGGSIAPGCSVGDWAVVGAGAVVVRDIPTRVTAKGVPARW